MLALSLGAVAAVAAISFYWQRRSVRDLSSALVNQTLHQTEDRIKALVQIALDTDELEQKLLAAQPLDKVDCPRLFAELAHSFEIHGELSYIGLGLVKTGDYWMLRRTEQNQVEVRSYLLSAPRPVIQDYAAKSGRLVPLQRRDWDSYDFRERPFFKEAQRARTSVWTATYPFWRADPRGAVPGITYTTPIYDAGQLAVVIDVDFDIYSLCQLISGLQPDLGRVFVVEERSEGRHIVAHPNATILYDQQTGQMPSAEDVPDTVTRAALQQLPGSFAQWRERTGQQQELTVGGESYLMSCRVLPGPRRPNWGLVMVLPKSAVMANVWRNERWLALAVVVVLGVAILATWLLCARLARPLQLLEHQALGIAGGQLDNRVRLQGPLELMGLAAAFNNMAANVEARNGDLIAANQALQASQTELRELFHNTSDFIVLVRVLDGGRFIYEDCNPAAEKVLGVTVARDRGKAPHEVMPPASADLVISKYQECVRKGLPVAYEHQPNLPAGRPWLHNIAVPIRSAAGKITHVAVIGRDLTADKRAEEERATLQARLYQSQKLEAIGRMAAGITHDFKNLLTGILGYAELLEASLGNTELGEMAGRIVQTAERATELAQEVLGMGREQPLHRRPVRLEGIIEEVAQLLRPTLPPGVNIQLDLSSGGQEALVDAGQMHRVLVNLCTNAIQAMAEQGGTLTLRLRAIGGDTVLLKRHPKLRREGYLALSVIDTGPGMDEKTLGHAFEPFYTTKGGKGTGLGLAVVHGIVLSHEGAVELTSAPGKGTTVEVLLPAAPEPIAVGSGAR
jgi:PAS domain S-box-containing protein